MNDVKEMRLGEEKVLKAGIDEKAFKTKTGNRIKKKDQVKLVDNNGRESVFYVHRIIGKRYIVLKESRKKSKLGLIDSLHLGVKVAT